MAFHSWTTESTAARRTIPIRLLGHVWQKIVPSGLWVESQGDSATKPRLRGTSYPGKTGPKASQPLRGCVRVRLYLVNRGPVQLASQPAKQTPPLSAAPAAADRSNAPAPGVLPQFQNSASAYRVPIVASPREYRMSNAGTG